MFLELVLVLLVSYKLNWDKKQKHHKMRQEEKNNEDASKLSRVSLNRIKSEHSENVSKIHFEKNI